MVPDSKQKLVIPVVLLEEATQILFQPFVLTGQGFKHTDTGLLFAVKRSAAASVHDRASDGEGTIHPAAEQYQRGQEQNYSSRLRLELSCERRETNDSTVTAP